VAAQLTYCAWRFVPFSRRQHARIQRIRLPFNSGKKETHL
jgi:hypothetical protein